jgi:hypothetical protein
MRHFRVAAMLIALSGCYSYATIDPANTQPGTSVRARINGQTADQLEPLLGMETRILTGLIIAAAPDTMIIEVPISSSDPNGGRGITRLNQRVSVPRSGMLELESRTLNRGRTAIVAASAGAGITALIVTGYILGPGKEKLPGEPGGPDLRFPIVLKW